MVKKTIGVLIFLFLIVQLYAQIQPITSHYMFHPQWSNPAFYGKKDGINFGANYRHQWAKLEGQPKTMNVFADAAIPQARGAVGFTINTDWLGAFTNTKLNVGYTYIQPIKNKIKFSIGLNAGVEVSKLDGSKLITPEGDNTGLNDDYLSQQTQRSIRPNLTLGVAVQHQFVEAGISYSNAINAKDKFKGTTETLKPKYGSVFQTYIAGNIKIKKDFSLKPSIVINTDFKEIQTDISIIAGYKDYIGFGISARGYNKRSFESLTPIISVGPIKNICIIYSYDVNLTKLNAVNKGTHELSVTYFLPNSKFYRNPTIINNPRFL